MFIESIRIENGIIYNLNFHKQRISKTQLYFYNNYSLDNLEQLIKIPKKYSKEILKCRIIYANKLVNIEYNIYTPKKIISLALVHNNGIDYSYKFLNRDSINNLFKQNYDDILIIKNNYVTDTSFSNIVFFDGKEYFTPTTYLLNGIQRQFLLKNKIIKQKIIKSQDITQYKEAFLINSMLNWENKIKINIDNIT